MTCTRLPTSPVPKMRKPATATDHDDSRICKVINVCLGEVLVTLIAGSHFSRVDTSNARAAAHRVTEGLQ